MEPSRNYAVLVQEIDAISESIKEAKDSAKIIECKVEEMITHIQVLTEDRAVRQPLDNLVSWLKIKGYESLAARVQKVTSPEFIMAEDIKHQLNQWVSEDAPYEDRNRINARNRIINFLEDERNTGLFLNRLRLGSVPNIYSSPLISKRVSTLLIDSNFLTSLPPEIGHLQMLKYLFVGDNQLSTLPTEISQLTALIILSVVGNQLREVPAAIGELKGLEELRLGGNELTGLPTEIGQCYSLRELELNNNELRTLPGEIGQLSNLRKLNLNYNWALTGIPMEMLNLNRECIIDISQGMSLSQTVLDNLRSIVTAPGYTGPKFSYSMAHTIPQDLQRKTIEESLASLYKIVGRPYEKLNNIPGEDVREPALKAWLSRLSYMSDYKASPEKKRWLAENILGYLQLADKDKDFRQVFNGIIDGAAVTCGDRVALSVVHLGIHHKLATIDLSNMKELAHFLIRGVFAMSLLEEIARNKVPTLPFFDEIEVYLGYPVMLKDKLQLPIDIQGMLHFNSSALTQRDLEDAASFVEKKLNDENACLDFLITDDKWLKSLSLNFPQEYASIENERSKGGEAATSKEELIQLQTKRNQSLVELSKQALKI